jgi:hypothetical protein
MSFFDRADIMTVRLLMKNIAVPAIQHLCAGISEILAAMLLMNSQARKIIQGDHSKDYMGARVLWARFYARQQSGRGSSGAGC